MVMPWRCFLVEPAGVADLYLRRFTFGSNQKCPASGYGHNAKSEKPFLTVSEQPPQRTAPEEEKMYWPSHEDRRPPQNDPRWPICCRNEGCFYRFAPEDEWQVSPDHYYRRVDEPTTMYTERDLPPGAMFDAFWLPWTGQDGKSMSVILPPGGMVNVWHIDGEARSGGHWTREGEPPNITASPSIKSSRYHGFLQNGTLTSDVEGQVFPDEPRT
jgi:hypothetical protein